MIIQDTGAEVKMFGQMEVVEFEIKTDDAKMFHILSNLYSDPLGAVVREISTNCIDGHKINNQEKPFDIILPGYLDMGNFITFRDYGPGMTHENIKDIYTKFGQSTKSNSNDQTGCLGLGSKSPLAITNSFTVTSIANGIKTVYSVSKDGYGKPNLAVFGSSETEEENGLSVTIPLTDQYVGKLQDTIRDELKYFKVKPRIMKGKEEFTNFRWDDPSDGFFQLSDTMYIQKLQSANKNESSVIQGEIGYDFSASTLIKTISVNPDLEDYELTSKLQVNEKTYELVKKFIQVFSIKMFVDMGTASFSPNREELIYDTATSKNLVNYIIDSIKIIKDIYSKAFAQIENKYQLHSIKYEGLSVDLEDDLITNFIRRFKFDFFSNFNELVKLRNGEDVSSTERLNAIQRYNVFHYIDDITVLKSRYSVDNIYSKKIIKTSKWGGSITRSCEDLHSYCSSSYEKLHIMFIPEGQKFAKKHATNYIRFFNETAVEVILVRLKNFTYKVIEEFMKSSGLSPNSYIPFEDVIQISNYMNEQDKSIIEDKPVIIKSKDMYIRQGTLGTINRNIDDWGKYYTTTKSIKDDLVGIYVPTFNNKIVFSDRMKQTYPEFFKLYDCTNMVIVRKVIELLNIFGGTEKALMNTQVYAGPEKVFAKSKLIHFEDFIIQHINTIKLLNSLKPEPLKLKVLAEMDSEVYNILTSLLSYDINFDLDVKSYKYDHISAVRKELKANFKYLTEWFYDQESPFIIAYEMFKPFAANGKANQELFATFGLLTNVDSRQKFEELFNMKIEICEIDEVLSYDFIKQYDSQNFSRVRNRYSADVSSEISRLSICITDINNIDYARKNSPDFQMFHKLPFHTCELPPAPTEEELLKLVEVEKLRELDTMKIGESIHHNNLGLVAE